MDAPRCEWIRTQRSEDALRCDDPGAAALAWVYLFHFGDMNLKVWKGWGLDFSAHTGVAIAVGCTLAALGRLWATLTVVVWIAYAFLMIQLGYHSLHDILSTSAAVFPGTIAAQFLLQRRGTVSE